MWQVTLPTLNDMTASSAIRSRVVEFETRVADLKSLGEVVLIEVV